MRLEVVATREAALASRTPADVEPFSYMFFPMTIKSSLTLKILFASRITAFEMRLENVGRSGTKAQCGGIQRAVRGNGTLIIVIAGLRGKKPLIGML